MSIVYVLGAMLFAVLGVLLLMGKATHLLAGIATLSGAEQERAVREVEQEGAHKAAGVLFLLMAVCLIGAAALPDASWLFGGIAFIGVLTLFAFANREAIRQYFAVRKPTRR